MVTQIIKHSSVIEDNIIIKLKRRVYLCECGKTFKDINPFNNTKKKLTFQKEFKILEALKDINNSFTDVAKEFDISVTSVQNIFDTRININCQPFYEVLCIDEVYSKNCGYHRYCFMIYSS